MVKADSTPLHDGLSYLLWNALIVVPWILGGFRAPVWVSLLLVVLSIAVIMSVRWDLQDEARRQAAVHAADEYRQAHPVWSFAAAAAVADLPSSCTVTRRLGWSAYRFRTTLTFIAVALWLNLFWPNDHALDSLFLGVSVALTLVCSLFQSLSWFGQVVADEEGLTVRTFYRRQRIRWKDARLFAIAATAGAGDPPRAYELSSATKILRWEREPKLNPLDELSTTVPGMNVLLALIHVRTGLPLLDLRRPMPQVTFSPGTTPF